jgi:hypothetical protein
MSVDTFVLVDDQRLPDLAGLQKALDDAEAGMTLDTVDDLRAHTGFWPIDFKGRDSGFEWYYGTVDDTLGETPPWSHGYSHVVQLVTFSEMHELVCALFVGGVLANLTNGELYDPQGDEMMTGDESIRAARQIERDGL